MELFKKLLLAATVAIVTGNASAMRQRVDYNNRVFWIDDNKIVYFDEDDAPLNVLQKGDLAVHDKKLADAVRAMINRNGCCHKVANFVKSHITVANPFASVSSRLFPAMYPRTPWQKFVDKVSQATNFVKAYVPTADLKKHITGRNTAGVAGFVVPCCVGCSAAVCATPAACCVLCGCATGCACACQKGYDMVVAAHVHAPVAPSMPR